MAQPPPPTHDHIKPPPQRYNMFVWIRKNLFASWYDSLLTLFFAYLLYHYVPIALNWVLFDADFFTKSREQCTSGGACWGVVTQRVHQYLYGFYPPAEYWRPNLTGVLLVAALLPILWDKMPYRRHLLKFSVVFPLIAFWLLLGRLGLPPIESQNIGGLTLTLTLGVMGIGLSLPVGIVLALGRRSHMPAVRILCVMFIELIRGVPMITLLFMATVLLPLFLPGDVVVDHLYRIVFIVTMFSSAYIAEVVRGGLQAIPKGQFEAASALGLGYWQSMRLIILPQALKISIPGIVNTFIGLFKDTTLVIIVGMFDLLGVGRAALANKQWIGLSNEVYTFIALTFFIFCYGMARYSLYLENKLKTSHD